MPTSDLPPPIAAEEIFGVAIALPVAERALYLEAACAGQPAVRARLEQMLKMPRIAAFLQMGENETMPPEIEAELARLKPEGGGERIGDYKLLQQIGEGGYGTVWMAEQIEPVRRRVALKIIKLGMDTKEVIARFEQERQALAMMDHPNIAKVLDAGATSTGRPFFVMELVRGIKITDYCDQANLPTAERIGLFIAVCKAVQHAHQKGIIHRDLKPSNILITLHDGGPVPKVIDFGVAKATQSQRLTDLTLFTQFEQMIGTPLYMSPEQAEMSGLDVDTRSDIYSLGVLLYELLTGCTPFDPEELMRKGLEEIRRAIREQEPRKPSTALHTMAMDTRTAIAQHRQADGAKLMGLIRGDLDWIVMKALEKDRTRRYETANGLALDLQRHLDNEPVLARPASTLYRLRRLVRRNRLAFTAATAVAIAVMAGLGVSTSQMFAARRAQRATDLARSSEREQRMEAQSALKIAETQQARADAQARKAAASEQQSRRLLYAAEMNLGQQALKQNNLGRARRLLERHRPQNGQQDLRGWEWRYLWQLTRSSALVTLANRPVRGFSVSFSSDGTHLAVGWHDGRVDLWDVASRRLVRHLTAGEYSHAGRVAFSPARNSLAATSEPTVVALYDLDSGRNSILWRAPEKGVGEVRDLSFSPDGSKLAIYTGSTSESGSEAWVIDVSSAQMESRHRTVRSGSDHHGAAQLSPDNRRLYLPGSAGIGYHYSIQCIDLTTGKQVWQSKPERDLGLTTLALSPDGQLLASGAGFGDPTIRIWDAATGHLLRQLEGHTGWVGKLAFTKDGRRLISAAVDQSIRFWDTTSWTEMQVLRGHTDEVHTVAISETAHLVASAGKDGNLILWRDDGKSATDGYQRPQDLAYDEVLPLDHSRLLVFPADEPPAVLDLNNSSPAVALPEIGSSTSFLGFFGTKILCHWSGTNQIVVREWRGAGFVERGAITLASGTRPSGCAYHITRELLAWSEAASLNSVYVTGFAAPARLIELKSDVPELAPYRFSEDGIYLAARKEGFLRVWNLETGQILVSINNRCRHATFAAGGRVIAVALGQGHDHEVAFYDLTQPGQPPRLVPGRHDANRLVASSDGALVALCTSGGLVRLFDPARGERIADLQGHLNSAASIAFSPNGDRLISTSSGGREAVKLWDLDTRQELLTLDGTGSLLDKARWSADGDMIVAGLPWQAWRAPSWEEIARTEKENTNTP